MKKRYRLFSKFTNGDRVNRRNMTVARLNRRTRIAFKKVGF